jgi:hypothetical protein
LLDYRGRWEGLIADRNPFAAIVLAHLEALATRRHAARRRQAKVALVRRLYDLGYGREEVLRLFRLIDWLLRLPAGLEATFWNEIRAYEEERAMTYITSVERIGIERGRREGQLDTLAVTLERLFGPDGRTLVAELRQQADDAALERVVEGLRTATTVEELRSLAWPPGD